MKLAPLAFLDTETLGVRAEDPIWEWGIITGDPFEDGSGYRWKENLWHVKPDLSTADAMALIINDYYGRLDLPDGDPRCVPHVYRNNKVLWRGWRDPREAAFEIARTLAGRIVVGAVVNFDTEKTEPWLRAYGQAKAWKYHLVDVEALAAGYVQGIIRSGGCQSWGDDVTIQEADDISRPDWHSTTLCKLIGVEPPSEKDRHTALGDARWARDVYCKVYGLPV